MLLLSSDGRTGLCTQEDALASCRDSGAHPLGSSEDDGRDDGGDDGGVGSPQSSAGLDLTIGMQALIHPDSFSDDVGGVISDDESSSGVPAHWGEVLATPEKATGACYLPRTPGSLLDAAADACVDHTDGITDADETTSPCMADMFMALQAQGIAEVSSDGSSLSNRSGQRRRSRRQARPDDSMEWLPKHDAEEHWHDLSDRSSDSFGEGVEGISVAEETAASTLHRSIHTANSYQDEAEQAEHGRGLSRMHESPQPDTEPRRSAASGECFDTPVRASVSALAGAGTDCSAFDESSLGTLPQTLERSARKPPLSPSTPITPASCIKRRAGEPGSATAARGEPPKVRFCDGIEASFDDKWSPICSAHRTPTQISGLISAAAPVAGVRDDFEQVAVNLSRVLGSLGESAQGNGSKAVADTRLGVQANPPPTRASRLHGENESQGTSAQMLGAAADSTANTSNSSSSSQSSRRSLLAHPAFFASPLERERRSQAHGTDKQSGAAEYGDNLVVDAEPPMVKFCSDCQWGVRGGLDRVNMSAADLSPTFSASLALLLRADGTFLLAIQVLALSSVSGADGHVVSASSFLGTYDVDCLGDGTATCSLRGAAASPALPALDTTTAERAVQIQGTLYGGARPGGGDGSGGLHLHSLEGLLGHCATGGTGANQVLPDQVREQLARLRRVWGNITSNHQASALSFAETVRGGLSTSLGATPLCKGALVECRHCHNAVKCDSSTILAWVREPLPSAGTHGTRGTSLGHTAPYTGPSELDSQTMSPRESGAGNAEDSRLAGLRDSLSPAGKRFHDTLLMSLVARASGGRHGGREDMSIEEATATLRRLASTAGMRGSQMHTQSSFGSSRRASWPMDYCSSWNTSEASSLGDSCIGTRGYRTRAWAGYGLAPTAQGNVQSREPREGIRGTWERVQRDGPAQTASGAALASMRMASRRIFSAATTAKNCYGGRALVTGEWDDRYNRRHVSRFRLASPSRRSYPPL